MGNQHRILSLEFGSNCCTQRRFFSLGQGFGLLGVKVGLNQKTFRDVRHVRKTCKRLCAKVECTTGSGPSSPAGRMCVIRHGQAIQRAKATEYA